MTKSGAVGVALIALGLLILAGPAALVLWMRSMFTTGLSVHATVGMTIVADLGFASLVTGAWLLRHGRVVSYP